MRRVWLIPVFATFLQTCSPAQAQDAASVDAAREEPSAPVATAAGDLARASQNPVGNVISAKFENNFYFGVGPSESMIYMMNLKPVYPVNLGRLTMINRMIVPVIYDEGQNPEDLAGLGKLPPFDGGLPTGIQSSIGSEFGLGDITYQAYFTPSKAHDVIFGIGPSLTFPTHTADRFGSDLWSAGPAMVLVTMPGHWVLGTLIQQNWSYAGPSDADNISKLIIQYFINYNFDHGWYLTTTPVNTKNWEAESGNDWTVPVGGGIGKLHKFGKQPVDFKLQSFYNVVTPRFGAEWQIQFSVKFLF